MRRLALVAVLTLGLVGIAAPQSSAGLSCDRTIAIQGSAFTPDLAKKVVQDDLVMCWENHDGVNHTATSNSGMFDTGIIMSGVTAGETLYGAGSYAYHCQIHAFMAGTFKVRPAVSDASIVLGQQFKLTVGDQRILKGVSWDVQKRRNDGPWITFKTQTTDASFSVKPGRTGTFRYRARTHFLENVSGWSPVLIVLVSAG